MGEAVELISKALEQLEEDAEGWFQLGTVGQRLQNLSPEFDTRTFGHAKLSDLVEATGRFEINRNGQHVRLRPKPVRGEGLNRAAGPRRPRLPHSARAHLVQPGRGAGELEGALALGIERVGLGRRRAYQSDLRLVERVDQGDEALGLVVAGAARACGMPSRISTSIASAMAR